MQQPVDRGELILAIFVFISVTVIGWYAMITTAPNSLMPRPHIRIIPEIIPFHDKGRDIVKKTLKGEACSVLAAFSNRGSIAAKACRAEFTRNGTETNAIATEIPATVLMTCATVW